MVLFYSVLWPRIELDVQIWGSDQTYGAQGTQKMDSVPNIDNIILNLKEMLGRAQLFNKSWKNWSTKAYASKFQGPESFSLLLYLN